MIKWIFLFFPLILFGNYVGNPASPGLMQTGLFSEHNYLINLSTGYIYDISWDKKIFLKKAPQDVLEASVEEFQVASHWTAISVTLLRKLSFYSYLGISEETMEWSLPKVLSASAEIGTKNHFSYSVGATFLLMRLPTMQIGLDAQYFSIPSSESIIKKIGIIYWVTGLSYEDITLEEWHIALATVKHFGPFSAYLGGKYGEKKLLVQLDNHNDSLLFREKYPVGIFTGASLNFSRNFYVNIEGRFFDEYALSFAAIAAF